MSAPSRPDGGAPPSAFDAEWEAPEGPTLDAEGRLTGALPRPAQPAAPESGPLVLDRRGWQPHTADDASAPLPPAFEGGRLELAHAPVHDSRSRRPAEFAPVHRSRRRRLGVGALLLALLGAGAVLWTLAGRPLPAFLPQGAPASAARLQARGAGGVLTITSAPAGARVRIDGQEVGTTPWAGDNRWVEGEVPLELTLPGHRPWKGHFRGGEDARLQVALQRAR